MLLLRIFFSHLKRQNKYKYKHMMKKLRFEKIVIKKFKNKKSTEMLEIITIIF